MKSPSRPSSKKRGSRPSEVRRRNAQWIGPTDDERLTLVTCWPYTSNTHRVIVVAEPIGYPLKARQ